jgi:two-component system, LytTR family, response regulator
MQLRCVVIDDEPWAFELIKKYVSLVPFLELVQTLYDPAKAIEFLQNNKADLLFIDINIPEGSSLLASLINKPITIFTTAYKKYALKGFEFGVLDYLLKPLDFERFRKAADRAVEFYKYLQYSKHECEDYLFVRSGYKTIKIHLNEIEYIEGFADYIRINLKNENPVITMMTLKSIIEKLPAQKFKRIHRSYIVALSQIAEIKNKKIILFSKKELPVSRSYKLFSRELKNKNS